MPAVFKLLFPPLMMEHHQQARKIKGLFDAEGPSKMSKKELSTHAYAEQEVAVQKKNEDTTQKTNADSDFRVNAFTYPMLAIQLFLCKPCRDFLANQQCKEEQASKVVHFTVQMCESCRKMNWQMRGIFKSTMWPKK
jgi:hypothetical protein